MSRLFPQGWWFGLAASALLCAGCWTDIPYSEETEPGQEAPPAATEGESSAGSETGEVVATPPPAAAASDPIGADDLFSAVPEPDAAPQPQSEPEPASAASNQSLPLLPWEQEEDRYAQADRQGAQTPEAEPATTAPEQPLLPWESPSAQAPPTAEAAPPTTPPAKTEPAPQTAVSSPTPLRLDYPEPEAPLPLPEEPPPLPELAGPEDLPPPFDAPQPPRDVRPEPSTPSSRETLSTQQVAWLLGSKWSYWMLASEQEAEQVTHELQPLAALLGITLPPLERPVGQTRAEVAADVLATSRKWGNQLGQRFGADHAALVEVAVKSNVLLAIYADRPHLSHAIGGSVAAASVRADLPQEIWQPWQDRVVAGGPVEGIQEAVFQLHREVESYLGRPTNGAAHAIRR